MLSQCAHPALGLAAFFVATIPGPRGVPAAFAGEFVIAFILMMTVLIVSNTARLARWTGLFAGFLVASFTRLCAEFTLQISSGGTKRRLSIDPTGLSGGGDLPFYLVAPSGS